eukprot:101624-Pleurochrysis_carterae.AAC.2
MPVPSEGSIMYRGAGPYAQSVYIYTVTYDLRRRRIGARGSDRKFAKGIYLTNYSERHRDTHARFHERTMSHRTANTATEVSSRPPSPGHTRAELGLSRTRGVHEVGDELSSGD